MSADLYPLPAYKHLPGINPRPQDPMLNTIALQAHAQTDNATARENPAWCFGLRLLNAGFYWESHEVLEVVWQRAMPNSRERFLVQGVIHIANAALKASMQKRRAAKRLSYLALGCVSRACVAKNETLMGVEGSSLRETAERCSESGYCLNIQLQK